MLARLSILMAVTLGLICTGCSSDPGWPPRRHRWKTIILNDTFKGDFDAAWSKTVNTIAHDYDIEMLEKDSGYLKTGWRWIPGGTYNVHYRGRITIRYPTTESPSNVEFITDAQWLSDPDRHVWVEGFDRVFERDVYTSLSGVLGRTVPTN